MRKLILIVILLAPAASGRNPDGTLGLIQRPNSGRPAIAAPEQAFTVQLTATANLALASDAGRIPLTFLPAEESANTGTVIVPAATPPGRYTLEATNSSGTDSNPGVVFVREEAIGNYYAIAHLGGLPGDPAARGQGVQAINQSDAILALLSDLGADLGYEELLPVLEAIAIPVYVAPPAAPAARARYQRYFAAAPYTFEIGEDAYFAVAFSAHDSLTDLTPAGNTLYPLRRAERARRWSIGFTAVYLPFADMRSQWALLSDDPLDYLFAARIAPPVEDAPDVSRVPWGATTLVYTPPLSSETLRIVDVTAAGLKFRPLSAVAQGEQP